MTANVEDHRRRMLAHLEKQQTSKLVLTWVRAGTNELKAQIGDNTVRLTEFAMLDGPAFHVVLNDFDGLGCAPTLSRALDIAENHPKVTKLLNARAAA